VPEPARAAVRRKDGASGGGGSGGDGRVGDGPGGDGRGGDGPEVPALLDRFDLAERALHWVNAALLLTMLATGSALYIPQISSVIGRRGLVLAIHVYAGIALPFPILLTAAGRRWGRRFRADARRLNRWNDQDRGWVRHWGRDPFVVSGKFNAGQKLNAAFTVGTIIVMLATGLIMKFPYLWPLSWRTGATFVHDWVYLAALIVVLGHIGYALNDPDSLRSMVRGTIPSQWARRHAPAWFEEETGVPAARKRRR
jgi:formate dehydrogenase subunit gamma